MVIDWLLVIGGCEVRSYYNVADVKDRNKLNACLQDDAIH